MADEYTPILSKEKLLLLFQENLKLLQAREVKERIRNGVSNGKAATETVTEIQEELMQSLGINPDFGLECLGRISSVYQDDMELMTRFFEFVAAEESACEEAELPADVFEQKMKEVDDIRFQQHEMLLQMRQRSPSWQSKFLQRVQDIVQQAQSKEPAGHTLSQQEILNLMKDDFEVVKKVGR